VTLDWHSDDRVDPDNPVMETLERLLTTQQLAAYLAVPVATLYAWRYTGDGPPGFRVGKHLRYRSSDVDQWIQRQRDTPQRRTG
jgi:excisionase family DNA binding protein